MANFDLSKYETVEERHARAIALHPDLRCVTINHTTPADRAVGMWVVEARVYLTAGDQANDLPKATEWAFEIDGQGMANKTSALENAATSALGRCLRWALGGSKGPSREEMAKAERGVTPRASATPVVAIPDGFAERLKSAADVDELQLLWNEAVAEGFAAQVQDAFTARKKAVQK